MKKYILFIFLFIFFLIPKDSFALSYDVDNVTYNVTDSESLRDYIYYTYVNDISKPLFSMIHYQQGATNYHRYEVIVPNEQLDFGYTNFASTNYPFFSSGMPSSVLSNNCTKYYFNDNFYFMDSETIIGNCKSSYNTYWFNNGGLYYPNYYLLNESTLEKLGNYSYTDIVEKYSPVVESEVTMFDVVETFLIQFINVLPFLIPFILVINLICRMLFNERS